MAKRFKISGVSARIATFILSVLMILPFIHANSQRLIFSSDYNQYGSPQDSLKHWMIRTNGGHLYMMYFPDEKLQEGKLSCEVTRLKNLGQSVSELRVQKIFPGQTFAAWMWEFNIAGTYLVSILNDNEETLISDTLTIHYSPWGKSHASDYYGAEVEIGDKFEGERLVDGEISPFEKTHEFQKIVRIKFQAYLNSDLLKIDLWRIKDTDEFSFIETQKFNAGPKWKNTWFKIGFPGPGNYLIGIYNEEEALICLKEIAIEKQHE